MRSILKAVVSMHLLCSMVVATPTSTHDPYTTTRNPYKYWSRAFYGPILLSGSIQEWPGVACRDGDFAGTDALKNNCFRIYKLQIPITRGSAQAWCSSVPGGRLAELRSDGDYLLVKQHVVNSGVSLAWIGGTKLSANANWTWDSDNATIQPIGIGYGGDRPPTQQGFLLLGANGMIAKSSRFLSEGVVCERYSTLIPELENLQKKALPYCPKIPRYTKVKCSAKSYGLNYTSRVRIFGFAPSRGSGIRALNAWEQSGPKQILKSQYAYMRPNSVYVQAFVLSEAFFWVKAGRHIGMQNIACKTLGGAPEGEWTGVTHTEWKRGPFRQIQVYRPIHTAPQMIVTLDDGTRQKGLVQGNRVASVKCTSYIDAWTGYVTLKIRCKTRQRTITEKSHRIRLSHRDSCPYEFSLDFPIDVHFDVYNCSCGATVTHTKNCATETRWLPSTVSEPVVVADVVPADMSACDNRPAARRRGRRAPSP